MFFNIGHTTGESIIVVGRELGVKNYLHNWIEIHVYLLLLIFLHYFLIWDLLYFFFHQLCEQGKVSVSLLLHIEGSV